MSNNKHYQIKNSIFIIGFNSCDFGYNIILHRAMLSLNCEIQNLLENVWFTKFKQSTQI